MNQDTTTPRQRQILAAYAAGIMDGEGSISILQHKKTQQVRLAVQIGQGQKGWPMLDFMKSHFDAILTSPQKKTGNRAVQRMAIWSGKRAYRFLSRVRHYMLIKQEHAELAMAFYKWLTKNETLPQVSWTPKVIDKAARYSKEMKALNAKGPGASSLKYPMKEGILIMAKGEYELQRAAKILGKKGGKSGGPARAAKLSSSRRSKIAAQGGRAKKGSRKRR